MEWVHRMGTNPSTRKQEQVMVYSYENYIEGIDSLTKQINRSSKPDYICGIHRGGLISAVHLSYKLKIPFITLDRRALHQVHSEVYDILTDPQKSVIIVDEIIDSGETVGIVNRFFERDFQWACLVYNISQEICKDPYYHTAIDRTLTNDYVIYFWDND